MSYLDTPIGKFSTLLLIQDMRFALDQLLKTVLKVDDHAWAAAIGKAETNRPCDLAVGLINQADNWLQEAAKEGIK